LTLQWTQLRVTSGVPNPNSAKIGEIAESRRIAKNPAVTLRLPYTWKSEEIEYGFSAKSPDGDMFFSVESATGDEFQTIKTVRQQHARLAVLALGRHPEALLAVRALKAGAAGYLPMDASQPQLLAAVNAISKGKKYLPSDLVEVLADNLNVDWDKPRHDILSDREFQTLRMLGSGRTLGEIAEALQISVKTVSVYRGRVLSKMKLRNNAELTMYVVSNGLQL